MPNFNPFNANVPVVRPELVNPGLSLIVNPTYDYKTTFPETDKLDNGGDPAGVAFTGYDQAKADRMKLLGAVQTAPAASTDYETAKRYNRSDLGFVGGRDNEDLYAQNQSFLNSVGNGLGRLAGLTVTKTGTGLGYLAGLVGLGNDHEKYGGNAFNSWIAGAGDNAIAKWFNEVEDEDIKNDWLPIYKKATEKDHGFFRHMGDLDFWTDDLTDGMAFMASSYIPGMAVSKLSLGTKVLSSLAALRGIGYTEEAAALATTGVEGTVDSENLIKQGVGATIETPDVNGTIHTTPVATQEIPRVIKWIDNAKAIRNIDVGTTSVINTASQAMASANEAKNNAFDTLIRQKDEDGNNKYTPDQAKQISAKVARDSYLMNLGALSLMNLWEANFLFKKPSVSNALKGAKLEPNGLFGDATLAKKTFGNKAWDLIKEPGKGVLTAGVWLGNMQLAIDRLNQNSDNFNLDFGDKLKSLGKQYVTQLGGALTGSDIEAQKSIGGGAFVGAVAGKLLHTIGGGETDVTKSLADLNSKVSAFRDLGNVYKTNADGSLALENGAPVMDQDKIKSWVASMNNVLSLNQVARNFEGRGIDELAKIYQDETFARFAKAHFDAGMSDLLHQKLSDASNIKQEDLALLGFDPDSKNSSTSETLARLNKKSNDLESLYNNIQSNFIPSKDMKLNTKAGQQKYFDMTDKMFYLSARAASINDRLVESRSRYDEVQANADSYNQEFNAETDATVQQYNEMWENLQATKRSFDNYRTRYDDEVDTFNRLNEGEEYIPQYGRPAANTSDVYTEMDEQFKASVAKSQRAIDGFVQDNKEVLQRLKKDANGRYLYEITNKNLLPSAKEMERQQIVQAELGLAHNATLNVLSRLADPQYGEKYYDQIYSKQLQKQAMEHDLYSDLNADDDAEAINQTTANALNLPKRDTRHFKQDLTEDQIDAAYDEAVENSKSISGRTANIKNEKEVSEYLAEKIATGKELTDKEQTLKDLLGKSVNEKLQERAEKVDMGAINEELFDTVRKRDALEQKDDRTPEEEDELDKLNQQVDALQDQRDTAFDNFKDKMTIENSKNIPTSKKKTYGEVLKQIAVNKKRVQKMDDYYMVDGQQYRKVTDLIGDRIPPEQRDDPATQAAVSAGNSIDTLVKAYFSGDYQNDDFKNSMADKISQESYDKVIKSLDKVKDQLSNKGIEIVGSNVFVTDDALKVAGEIDLLGVDKDGNFKIYEIQARRGDVYRQYGKRGLGIKIRDIDSKRLSMYRNMFANQYGVIPDEIAVKFPVEVKYDRTNYKGFIDDAKMKDPIRFTPLKNVEIKMKAPEPLRLKAKFENIDMSRLFLKTFLGNKLDQDRLKFLFRNAKFEDIAKGFKLTVKPAKEDFQKRFEAQGKVLAGQSGAYTISKFKDFKNRDEDGNPKEFNNLYSLVGNTDISLSYEGQPVGYFSPLQTLAYKDQDGNFKILDENTDPETYAAVTGNSVSSYPEFAKIAAAYKKIHTELTGRMLNSPEKQLTLTSKDIKDLFDVKMSQGEFDFVKSNGQRPNLGELSIPGVKVGNKSVPVVVNLDDNDAVKVMMDGGRKGKAAINKYQDVDRWANQHIDDIKKAMTDQDGQRLTNNVGIVEGSDGDYRIISLRTKGNFDVDNAGEFVDGLGDKFTASVNKNVFKNENIMIVPKEPEQKIELGIRNHTIVSKVYEAEDVDSLEKFGLDGKHTDSQTVEDKVTDFLNNLEDKDKETLEDLGLTTKEHILDDYTQGEWSSIDDYIDNIKNCK